LTIRATEGGKFLSKVRALTAGEIIRALVADGFFLRKSRRGGGHQRYYHADGRRVTLRFHGTNTTFVPKTLRSIIEEQAGWTEEDLKRLDLISEK
jgi:predicted RNA binding protein YcfA (HicA-like mRNA interferase family)